jgi:hypothetical protein
MDTSTKQIVIEILEKELIDAHKREILANKDFPRFLTEGRI